MVDFIQTLADCGKGSIMHANAYLAPDFESQGDKEGGGEGHDGHESADDHVDERRQERRVPPLVEKLQEPAYF